LGQDPYPQTGVATGRAFEVGTLKSWNQPFKNISLKNILRALYKAYSGQIIKFSQLKEKFDNEFSVLPPGKLFEHWEKQGVLLLNTSFPTTTTISRKPTFPPRTSTLKRTRPSMRRSMYGRINCFEPYIGEIDWTGFNLKNGVKSAPVLF